MFNTLMKTAPMIYLLVFIIDLCLLHWLIGFLYGYLQQSGYSKSSLYLFAEGNSHLKWFCITVLCDWLENPVPQKMKILFHK